MRRLFAGELAAAERTAVEAHVAGCGECARRLEHVRGEQRAFEEQISFDRFAAGVERAARAPAAGAAKQRRWWSGPTSTWSFVSVFSLGAVAAAVALIVTARPLFEEARHRTEANAARGLNRVKGGASVTVRVAPAGDGPQRTAAVATPEALGVGERLRIGVKAGGRRYLFAISVDDAGAVTPLYPEAGTSVQLPPGDGLQYLPDSIELTGRGLERLIVLLTDQPAELDNMRRAVEEAFAKAKGDLTRLPDLALEGDQFHRTFIKP
jgi:anti-sigma factor RsiW